ncbi:uncharacterized protein LOC135075592 [Ostrinia nubilalis]|uniref:uncharacterized protein LOC135075592 n=1 Tax=Ostrinia nubilalis TaxID=29057 RepID=UPI00308251CB
MCCIFTCCGWMIDLIQRLWTFTMSCCISSAVCCALVTASMSGIALGYNYSLAEYIDLKETNVSVYLKRGVFDDEIADDMDWRRSGQHMPVQGHLKESNLATGGPEGPEEMPLRSGRRLDDSLLISDDQHKFEGSLMRLTAKPPAAKYPISSASPEPVTSDAQMAEILSKYPMGSLEQMKALQALFNMRRSGSGIQRHTVLPPTLASEGYELDGRRAMPVVPQSSMLPIDRYPIINEAYKHFNPARFAVPDETIRNPSNWFLPKNEIPDTYRRTMDLLDYELMPSSKITRPQPFRMSTEIQRPTKPKPPAPTRTPVKPQDILGNQDIVVQESALDQLKNKLLRERIDVPRLNPNQLKAPSSDRELKSEDDYEDEANKGLPIRKKRNKRSIKEHHKFHISKSSKNLSENEVNRTTGSILIAKLLPNNRNSLVKSTIGT